MSRIRRRGVAARRLLAAAAALVACAVSGCGLEDAGAGAAERGRARVERVVDGDTLVLRGLGRARLIGIDTPETQGGGECFGREAADFVRRALPANAVVRYRYGVERRDRYGRALLWLWLPDGRLLNKVLVAEGYALPFTVAPNVERAGELRRLSREARERGLGLWGIRGCAPPRQGGS